MPTSRGRKTAKRRRRGRRSPAPQKVQPLPWHHRVLLKYRAWVKQITALRLIIGVVLSSLSVFIANPVVKYVYNSCRETIPDVRPKNAAVSSILIPFTVQNRSALFVMRDVRITCKMPMIVWNNGADPSAPIEKGQMYPVAGGDWRLESKQAGVMIKEDSEINYPCDPDELIRMFK